jgi:hypothetical protein
MGDSQDVLSIPVFVRPRYSHLESSLREARRWINGDARGENTITRKATSISRTGFAHWAYWVTTGLVLFELGVGGVWDLLRVQQARVLIERLGYPPYFLTILGIWKLLGAVALAVPRFPRLKEWAYAGVLFDLTGAVASLVAAGMVSVGTTAYPVAMIGVAVASWALRPASRRVLS